MRVVVAALAGLAAASLLVAAGPVLGKYAYVAIVLGGLVAGAVMRALAGSAGSGYAKGGVAALVAAAAAILGPMVTTAWFTSQARSLNVAEFSPPAAQAAEEADPEEGESDPAPAAAETDERSFSRTVEPGLVQPSAQKPDFAAADTLALAIGCFLAYQIGKGAEPAKGEPDEPAGDPEPVAENANVSPDPAAG